MHEITPDEVAEVLASDAVVLVRLRYRPGPQFLAEKQALQKLGAVYRYRLGVWVVPNDPAWTVPLQRLLAQTSAVVYVAEPWEVDVIKREDFF